MVESTSAEDVDAKAVNVFKPDPSWPLLLKGILSKNSKENWKAKKYRQGPDGFEPLKRPINDYIANGFINLDKPRNPTSHEVIAWIKWILKVKKCGHSGTLDPLVTGCLIVCISKTTLLLKTQQNSSKAYIAALGLSRPLSGIDELKSICRLFKGSLYQRPPIIAAVKRELRPKAILQLKVYEYCRKQGLALLRVTCEGGSYIRTLCNQIGLMARCTGVMEDLRRIKSGIFTENDNMATMHDICDAKWIYEETMDESFLRKIIMPMEGLLVNYRRVVIRDSAVNSVCYGSWLAAGGILFHDENIRRDEEIVLITTKGELVALGVALVPGSEFDTDDQVMVACLNRVIMNRDVYKKQWDQTKAYKERKRRVELGLLPDRRELPFRTWKQWEP
ncbi:hypothetical protein Aperf_G00000107755 [Anoplocephala perfoliata]